MEYVNWSFILAENDEKEINAMQMEFSPDGKYFLGGRVFRFSNYGSYSVPGFFYSSWGINADQEAFIAFDLQENKEVKLGGDLKNVVSMPFAFYEGDKIIGQHRKDPEKSGIFKFPSGERVEKFFMNADSYAKPHQGDYIFVRPTTSNPVGAYDLKAKKFFASSRTPALDGYGDYFVSEGSDGVIDLHRMDKTSRTLHAIDSMVLPKNSLGDLRTIALSPDFEWLAMSEKTRGGVWDLKTGEMKIYIRGFRGSFFDPSDGGVYADFPNFEKESRMMGVMTPASGTGASLDAIETRNTRQFGKFLVRLKTRQDEKLEKKKQEGKETAAKTRKSEDDDAIKKPTFQFGDGFLLGIDTSGAVWNDGSLEVYDARSWQMLWSRAFADEVPKYQFDQASETVALYWNLTTKQAKNEIKNKPALAQKVKSLGERAGDYLVQILDSNTGSIAGETLIETGEGSFTIKKVFAAGDRLAVIDSENRVLLYSLSRGEVVRRFFGDEAILSPTHSVVAIKNFSGQISLYNPDDGRKIDELLFTSPVAHMAFSRDGKKIFVLTADQNYYLFDAEGFGGR